MRIAKLYMDPQDKQRFEIQGKSSVKYHLKANHQVEAKRWYWALNNSIQWAKDEAREEEKRATQDQEALKQAKIEQISKEGDVASLNSSKMASSRTFAPSTCCEPVPPYHANSYSIVLARRPPAKLRHHIPLGCQRGSRQRLRTQSGARPG
jgi:hypothetical protein